MCVIEKGLRKRRVVMLRDTIEETGEVESAPTWAPNNRAASEPRPRSPSASHRTSQSVAGRRSAEDHAPGDGHAKRTIAPAPELSADVVVPEKRLPEITRRDDRPASKLQPDVTKRSAKRSR